MDRDLTLFVADSVQFVMLSFEGPDLFSMAGGLGIRATEVCTCLASMGYETHLYFVGDPNLSPQELFKGIHLHRWSQWLSSANPGGCYMAEEAKVNDMATSLPEALINELIVPAAQKGKLTVILAEEWQTVPTVLSLRSLLEKRELSEEALILWNANNTYGFKGINWNDLKNACSITTVSRYMKHLMWSLALNPMVVHNGIPDRLFNPVKEEDKERLKEIFPDLL
ncbi:hypothetical protein IJT10_03620, partial [bacterium]|nr:hypothetical protein [bacterium]